MNKSVLAFILVAAFVAVKSQDVVEVDDLIVPSDRKNCKCCPAPCCCKCAEISTTVPTTPATNCVQKLDLGIIMDSSLSINTNYATQIDFVKNFVAEFAIGQDAVRVGLLQFATDARIEWNLDAYNDLTSLQGAIDGLEWMRSGTRTEKGFDLAVSDLFVAPGDRPDVPSIALVLTDGRPENAALIPAAAANLQSVARVVVIGVTDRVNEETLKILASDPDSDNVFSVGDFDALSSIINDLSQTICPTAPPSPPVVSRQCICCCPKPSPFGGFHGGVGGGYYGGCSDGCNCK